MKLIRKFSNYLLENHPLLWHTRSIQLTVLGLLLWLLSFVSGYLALTLRDLKHHDVSDFYAETGFLLFHIAIVTVVLALWALAFYKNNAFKSFYPISKLYFHKMFFLLFIPFLLLVTLYYPFTRGAHVKTRNLLSKENLIKDYENLRMAEAFLPRSEYTYNIDHKVFPKPFPLENIEFKVADNEWDNTSLKVIVKSKDGSRDSVCAYDYSDSNTTIIENEQRQFYSLRFVKIDSCNDLSAISKMYKFDTLTDKLELNSIWNFDSGELVQDYYPLFKDGTVKTSYKNYVPLIQSLANKKDWAAISKIINDAKKSLDRYEISYHLDTKQILRYLKEKNFTSLNKIIGDYPFDENDLHNSLRVANSSMEEYNSLRFTDKLEFYPTLHVKVNEIEQIYENYNKTYSSPYRKDDYYFFCFLALALTLVAVYFQIVKPIPFLLSMPVWGVLFILLGVYNLLLPSRYYYEEYDGSRVLIQFLVLFGIVQLVNLIIWKNGSKGKNIFNITLAMAIISSPFVLPLLLEIIHIKSEYTVERECFTRDTLHIFDGALESMPVMFSASLIGILLALFLARPWIAKQE